MNCRNCGTPLPSGAKVCPNCGTPVPTSYANAGGPENNPVAPTQYAPQQGASTGYGEQGGYGNYGEYGSVEPTLRVSPSPSESRPDPYSGQQGSGPGYYAPPLSGQPGQQGNGASYYAPPVQPGQQSNGSGYYGQPAQPGQQGGMPGYYGQPPVPQGPQGGQRRRSPALLIALIVVIVVLIIGGAGIFYFVNAHNTAVLHANATATASAAHVHATATAKTQAFATATAAAMNPYTQTGTLAFSDPLTSNNQGQQWDENGNCAFKNGTYHAIAPNPNFSDYCIANATNFTDFTLEVNMTILSGDAGAIVFRVENTNPNQYYKFVVANDGSYALLSDNSDKISILFQGSNTTAINAGVNQTNLIAVVAQGSKITAYSNHQMLDSVTDSTFNHGQIGVDATVLGHATEVAFSNMRVWKL